MAEREQAHRHRKDIGQLILSFTTRAFFLILALAVLGVAVVLILRGQTLGGLVALVSALGSFALIFIWGGARRAP
jgi:uncharacterized membrane protein